jgi:hypothetical protein
MDPRLVWNYGVMVSFFSSHLPALELVNGAGELIA